jgi:hypothetical protein
MEDKADEDEEAKPHASTGNRTLRPAPIHEERLHRQENCQIYNKAAFASRQRIKQVNRGY